MNVCIDLFIVSNPLSPSLFHLTFFSKSSDIAHWLTFSIYTAGFSSDRAIHSGLRFIFWYLTIYILVAHVLDHHMCSGCFCEPFVTFHIHSSIFPSSCNFEVYYQYYTCWASSIHFCTCQRFWNSYRPLGSDQRFIIFIALSIDSFTSHGMGCGWMASHHCLIWARFWSFEAACL